MPSRNNDVALTVMLNDLLQLEHDALPSYALAIAALRSGALRETLKGFREDHLRHVRELAGLVQARGGLPLRLPHLPTGLFKLAVQAAGLPGGDRAVLLAFRANEWQSRAKYGRAAGRDHAPDVAAVLRRAAADEARHYAWAVETLDGMGLGDGTLAGMANGAFALLHGTVADMIEAAGRIGLECLARSTRPI